MNKIIELNEYFAIEENDKERFLIDNWGKKRSRLVNIGIENEISYIKLQRSTGYYNFKVSSKSGIGLMQLKGSLINGYTDITGNKKCTEGNILQLSDVLVIPTEYEEISIDHIWDRFGVEFPIARKNENLYNIFINGRKSQKACGTTVFMDMRKSGTTYIPQIISYEDERVCVTSEFDEIIFYQKYNEFPQLCFIKNADEYSSIRPSYEEYKTDIWMYNAHGKVGIVYLNNEKRVRGYVIEEVPFTSKDNIYFINENYVIYNFHGESYLYFKGNWVGKISYFKSSTKKEIFLRTDKGFYIGQTFFDEKQFFDILYLHVENIYDVDSPLYDKEIILRSGTWTYTFKYDSNKDKVVDK